MTSTGKMKFNNNRWFYNWVNKRPKARFLLLSLNAEQTNAFGETHFKIISNGKRVLVDGEHVISPSACQHSLSRTKTQQKTSALSRFSQVSQPASLLYK